MTACIPAAPTENAVLRAFIRTYKWAIAASASPAGVPQAAIEFETASKTGVERVARS
jgi:hypothetical protein